MSYYAVDFGTSNSLLSYVSSEGIITSIPMESDSSLVLRSILYTPEPNVWFFGKDAIKEYVKEVKARIFPNINYNYPIKEEELYQIKNSKLRV